MFTKIFKKTERVKMKDMRSDYVTPYKHQTIHMFECGYGINYNSKHGEIHIVQRTKTRLPKGSLNTHVIKTILPFKHLLKALENYPDLSNFVRYEIITESLMFRIKKKRCYYVLVIEHPKELTKLHIFLNRDGSMSMRHIDKIIPITYKWSR